MGMLSLFFVSVPDARLEVGGILQSPPNFNKKIRTCFRFGKHGSDDIGLVRQMEPNPNQKRLFP